MQLTYKIIVSPRKKSNSYQVQIDGYRYLEELWGAIEEKGIIQRLEDIPQLGSIDVSATLKKTRYDYVMLQLYLHQFIRQNINEKLKISYNNYLSKDDLNIQNDIKIDGFKPTIADAMQMFVVLYNMGHFYNTFCASRAVIMSCQENKKLKANILKGFDEENKELAEEILTEKNYYRFHLLNSLLILQKCDKNKSSVQLAYALLKMYIKTELQNEKMKYLFSVFKDIRSLSYFIYDLPISDTPLYLDIRDKNALKTFLSELLDQYNNHQPINSLMSSIVKILDDTIYNEKSQGIVQYQISKNIEQHINKIDWAQESYYELFVDKNSIFNMKYPKNQRFNKVNILKVTFNENDRLDSMILFKRIRKSNFSRVGYYDRKPNYSRTLLVSLGNSCKKQEDKVWYSFKIVKQIISVMQKSPDIKADDKRYVGIVKFFLHYLLGEYAIQILPTIDKETCLFVKRGKSARIEYLDKLLEKGIGTVDQRHEMEFLKEILSRDHKNDTAIIICGSLVILDKKKPGKSLHEYDGMIIYPFREIEQIVFLESKNTKDKPGQAKKCLKDKLAIAPIVYDENDIMTVNHDCYLKYTIKR